MNSLLSIIVPSYKDPLLEKTIKDLLEKSEGEIEIIISLDGYWPDPKTIVEDKRVVYLHLGKNRGMRRSINAGVEISKGEYLMRVDEHQIFGQGYDKIILETIQDNWIVTPRRFFLDTVKWEVMDKSPVDYMVLKICGSGSSRKFAGVERQGNDKDIIQESMAMQGSCWFMKRTWWDKVIGELQTEGYGPLIQDSHEMVFKTWKAGGKLMVNKNTWHAHKHRSFPRCHNGGSPENRANCEEGYAYAIKIWNDYYNELLIKWNKNV